MINLFIILFVKLNVVGVIMLVVDVAMVKIFALLTFFLKKILNFLLYYYLTLISILIFIFFFKNVESFAALCGIFF